jgi:hypothetical protein
MLQWPHSQFRLFRIKEGEKFEFDNDILRSPTSARQLDYSCTGARETDCVRESVLVPNCIFELNATVGTEVMIDAHQMLTPEGKGYHVSFANLTNRESIQKMWDLLNLPFSLDQTNFEHAFISNLVSDQMTASFHANPITDSMGVQLVGKKTWLFLPSETYLSLMRSTFAGSALFPKQAPPAGSKPEVCSIQFTFVTSHIAISHTHNFTLSCFFQSHFFSSSLLYIIFSFHHHFFSSSLLFIIRCMCSPLNPEMSCSFRSPGAMPCTPTKGLTS